MQFRPSGQSFRALLAQAAGRLFAAGLTAAAMSGPLAAADMPAVGSGKLDSPIPASRFPKYVKFHGDPSNAGWIVNQARTDSVITNSEQPFFVAGFFRAEDFPTWGILASIQSSTPYEGIMALSTGAYDFGLSLYEWRGQGLNGLATAPNVHPGGAPHGPAAYGLNQWQFVAAVVYDRCNSQIFSEGLWGSPSRTCVEWPSKLIALSFGSYFDITQGPGEPHNFNGGLRDWAAVRGTPTADELEQMRAGTDPRKIWGARVWGYWHFTADPSTGAKEPDLTGNGHDLTYVTGRGGATKMPVPPTLTDAGASVPTPRPGVCAYPADLAVRLQSGNTRDICAVGKPAFLRGAGPWAWTCDGTDGGTSEACSSPAGHAPGNPR